MFQEWIPGHRASLTSTNEVAVELSNGPMAIPIEFYSHAAGLHVNSLSLQQEHLAYLANYAEHTNYGPTGVTGPSTLSMPGSLYVRCSYMLAEAPPVFTIMGGATVVLSNEMMRAVLPMAPHIGRVGSQALAVDEGGGFYSAIDMEDYTPQQTGQSSPAAARRTNVSITYHDLVSKHAYEQTYE
jgi:hypothetical protein